MGRLNLLAAAAALLLVAALGAGLSCLVIERCSLSGLFGSAPALDVPYAETRSEVVEAMLDLAAVGPGDRVVDLGTGDGRILIAAVRDRGAHGLGVDIDPVRIEAARAAARRAGVADRAAFRTQDLFETPLDDADVVAMFLLPEVNLRLRPRLLALEPGTRIVSHAFDMGEWPPDAMRRAGGATVYFWRVPARLEGRWRMESPDGEAVLVIVQRFQRFGGRVERGGDARPVREGTIEGPRLRFLLGEGAAARLHQGMLAGDAIEGDGWRAVRMR